MEPQGLVNILFNQVKFYLFDWLTSNFQPTSGCIGAKKALSGVYSQQYTNLFAMLKPAETQFYSK